MTLGNDPQPLTRRQLRELARAEAPESTDEENEPQDAGAAASAFAPRSAADRPDDAHVDDAHVDDVHTGDAQPDDGHGADDDAPRDHTGASPLTTEHSSERSTVPERTLTRRELRELMAARQAETGVVPDEDAVPSGYVIDEDVVGDDIPEDAVSQHDAVEQHDAGGQADAVDLGTPAAPELSLPAALNPPVGHWSIDRDVDEHTQVLGQKQPFDQLLSRGVAAGGIPTTTNALILPSIPQQGNSSGSLTSTGEILITGSIDLPRSLGSTGAHPSHFDSSEMDHMLDQLDEAGPTTSVAPVSASRAVSTHTSTRGVMTPPKKRAASLPVVLAVTAGVLLVGVLALFAAGYLFQIF